MMWFFHQLGRQNVAQAERDPANAGARRARGERLLALTWEDALREKVVVGSPDTVIRRLTSIQAELSLDGVLLEFNCGAKIPHELVLRSVQLFAAQVKPSLAAISA